MATVFTGTYGLAFTLHLVDSLTSFRQAFLPESLVFITTIYTSDRYYRSQSDVNHLFPSIHNVPSTDPTPLAATDGAFAFLESVAVAELASDDPEQKELILLPSKYDDRNDIGPDALWRQEWDASRCWKTTAIYEQIPHHSRVARFIRADPWTYLPVLAHPQGPPLVDFIKEQRDVLYELYPAESRRTANGRIRQNCLRLAYLWALQLASAVHSVHSESRLSIVLGSFFLESCWLTCPDYTLSLVGFLNAEFRDRRSYVLHHGWVDTSEPFHPLYRARGRDAQPTHQIDLFLWAFVVYELMTGHRPGYGQGLSVNDIEGLVPHRLWPDLESEYLGSIVHACWAGQITNSSDLLAQVRERITEAGCVITNGDELKNLDLQSLRLSHTSESQDL
ncbi:hypothetical protein BST61_g4205 [Cercospora zeina]